MGRPTSISLASRTDSNSDTEAEFKWPFGHIDYLSRSDIRETAYEVFFMSCRSSPGFGSRNAMTYPLSVGENSSDDGRRDGPLSPGTKAAGGMMRDGSASPGVKAGGAMRDGSGSPGAKGGTMMVVNSRTKKALGLKTRRQSMMRPMNQTGATSQSGITSPGRVRRPMTSAEIMRQQMRVTEQSDSRLRKTLMRTLVGQIFETRPGQMDSMIVEVDEDPGQVLIQLAKDTEALALAEKEIFSPILKRWHPVPAAIAVASLHHCFGVVLKQYRAKVSSLSNEMVRVLQSHVKR